jgi:hypothetical protein
MRWVADVRSAVSAQHTKSIPATTKQRWVPRSCGSCKGAGFSRIAVFALRTIVVPSQTKVGYARTAVLSLVFRSVSIFNQRANLIPARPSKAGSPKSPGNRAPRSPVRRAWEISSLGDHPRPFFLRVTRTRSKNKKRRKKLRCKTEAPITRPPKFLAKGALEIIHTISYVSVLIAHPPNRLGLHSQITFLIATSRD